MRILKFPFRIKCLLKGHKYNWQDKGGLFGFFESKYDYRCKTCGKQTTQEKLENNPKYKAV